MPPEQQVSSRFTIWHLVIALVFVGGFLFWVSDLTSDPPMYYTGLGQSEATDPAQYVFHARNKLLWGEWDPYDYPRWIVYQHSLVSLVAYIWFAIAGVSIKQAAAVGVMLSFAGMILFVLALLRRHPPWLAAAFALFYVINVTLLTYGRLSYLENGLLFFMGLLFFLYSWFGDRLWGLLLCGGVVALATFTGKLFGALLFPALLLAIWVANGSQLRRHLLAATGSFLVASAILIGALYGSDVTAAFPYGLRGFPEGLSSPWAFFEHLVSYGFGNRLFYLDPDVYVFLVAAAVILLLLVPSWNQFRSLPRTTQLPLVAAAVIWLALMPLNYSPLRYALFLIPIVTLSCLTLGDWVHAQARLRVVRPGPIRMILLSLLGWFAAYHLIRNVFFFNQPVGEAFTWLMLPIGLALAFLVQWLTGRWRLIISRRTVVVGLAGLILFSAVTNGFRIRRLHYLDHNFNIVEANEDISYILEPNAVVSGPYGPALTLDTRLRSFIHLFAVTEVDSTLFDRQPVTHIAVDASNYVEAVKNYPALKNASFVANYWIRDFDVKLYRVAGLFGNAEANAYQRSDFEIAQDYAQTQHYDSALLAMKRFMDAKPTTKSSGRLLADLFMKTYQFDQALQVMKLLADRYPTDFYLQMQCGRLYLMAAGLGRDPSQESLAKQYFDRGVMVNPYKAGYASELVQQTRQMFQQRQPPGGP